MKRFGLLFYFFIFMALHLHSDENVDDLLKKYIVVNPDNKNTIGHIYVGGHETAISNSTWLYIKQALEYYKKNKPLFIILELDTPGGEVFAAQKISDALKEMDIQHGIPIISYVNNWAISAGAMLAYSSRFIFTAKDGSMGAAEPITMGETGKMESASEKVNSAIRADFANRAQFFDRNPLIAEAMVDKDLILVMRDGKVLKLDNENQIKDTDSVITPKGKLLTLNAEEMMKYKVANVLLLPQKLPPKTPEEEKIGQWPLSKTQFNQIPFFAKIPNAVVDTYQMDWKTRFFVFLATPLVSSILFMGLIVGAYMEFNNPGWSLPGSVAAISLFLIALSSLSLEIANWLELILLLTGLAIILIELFVLPTFGLLGIFGVLLFFAGLFGMLIPEIGKVTFDFDSKQFNIAGEYFLKRLAWLAATLIASFIAIMLLARYLPKKMMGFKRFVLSGDEQDASRGFMAGVDPHLLPQPGEKGEVFATLRPAGKVIIQDEIYDVMSAGDFIEAGETVVVLRNEGGTLIVDRLRE